MEEKKLSGHLILLMAPSGSGKRMLIDSLGEVRQKLYFAKTLTTRTPRTKGAENPLYTFISKEEFQALIDQDALVEWAEYSGNYYGTPRHEVFDHMAAGEVVFKEMELQGVEKMREQVPQSNLTVIYVDAGSWDALERRIRARSPITEEELALRHRRYEVEVTAKEKADIIIENFDGQLETAQAEFHRLIEQIVTHVQ